MTCPQCSAKLSHQDAFCGECGQALVREAPVGPAGRARIGWVRLLFLVALTATLAFAAYYKKKAESPRYWEPQYPRAVPIIQLQQLEGTWKVRETNKLLVMKIDFIYSAFFLACRPEPQAMILLRTAGVNHLEGSLRKGKLYIAIKGEVADTNSMQLSLEGKPWHLDRVKP